MLVVLLLMLGCSDPPSSDVSQEPTAEQAALSVRIRANEDLHHRLEGWEASGDAVRLEQTVLTSTSAPRALERLEPLGLPDGLAVSVLDGRLWLSLDDARWWLSLPDRQTVTPILFARLLDEALRDHGSSRAVLAKSVGGDTVVWAPSRAEADTLIAEHPELLGRPALHRRAEADGTQLSTTSLPDDAELERQLGPLAPELPTLGLALWGLAKQRDGVHLKGFGVFRWRETKGHGVKRPDGTIMAPRPVRSLLFQPVGLEAAIAAGAPRPVTSASPDLTPDMAAVLEAVAAELVAGRGARVPHLGTFSRYTRPPLLLPARPGASPVLRPAETVVTWTPAG